jgi:integrase
MQDTESAADEAASPVRGTKRAKKRRKKNPRGIFERPKGSGIWWVRYRVRGRLYREKVGAMQRALDLYAKRKGEIIERRFFPERTAKPAWDPLFAGLRDVDGVPTLTGYVADYLARKGSTLEDLGGQQRYARYFAEAPETKGKTMRQLTRQDFERYRERRRLTGAPGARRKRGAGGVSTVNKELSFARKVFYDFIAALEERRESPIPNPARHSQARPLHAPEPEGRVRYLSEAEEARLRRALPACEWAKVVVAMHTGLDRGAMLGLRWADVDFTTRSVHAERRKGRRGEPIKVVVPINDDLLAVLRALPSRGRSEWVFPNATNTGPEDGDTFNRLVFQPALIKAGLTKVIETRETKQVRTQLWCGATSVPGWRTIETCSRRLERTFRWKDLRHTFATRLRMRGVDTGTIRDLLGHTSDRMTKRYAHATTNHLHEAVQRLSKGTETPDQVAPEVAPSVAHDGGGPMTAHVSAGRHK